MITNQNNIYIDKNNNLITVNDNEIENLLEKGYLRINFLFQKSIKNSFLDDLFNQGKVIEPFRFLIIQLEKLSQDNIFAIIHSIEELCEKIETILINDHLVIFYFDKYFFDFKDILDPITDDLAFDFKIFEGCKITSRDDFLTLIRLYFSYLGKSFYRYSSISDLVLKVHENNPLKIKELKHIILADIIEDQQLITIIKSLFENNLNITQSSQVVYMHRNTINNKLDMIKRLTGLNIQNFKEAVAMYLLLNA